MEGIKNLFDQNAMEAWFSQLNKENSPLKSTGLLKLLDPHFLRCDGERREIVFTFQAKPWEENPEGGIHGGIITTGFDECFGITCHYLAEHHMVCAANLSTTYLRPILPTDIIDYHIFVITKGKTLISLKGEARLRRDDILAATAATTFMILDKEFDLKL